MDNYSQFGRCVLSSMMLLGTSSFTAVQAQVIVPNGLGSNVSDGFCTQSCSITGGSRAEPSSPNLFHSFSQFSIPAGATATLHHDADIAHIFLRVTDAVSILEGQLATDVGGSPGNADLFLLNPQGIIFGSQASLNIGGSLIATTAEQVEFGTEPTEAFRVYDNQPILSIHTPTGLQLGATAGAIQVGTEQSPGPGHGFLNNRQDFSVERSFHPSGLAVPEGQTLALIGQGIELWGSNLTAAAGRLELGSLANHEGVTLSPNRLGWQLNYASETQLSDINLSQAASLDVSGPSSGQLHLHGHNITLSDGSALLNSTLGSGVDDGLIQVNATTLNLIGLSQGPVPGAQGQFSPINTGIFADVAPQQSGTGSDIKLIANDINITEGAQASISTLGLGHGGQLWVQANLLKIEGAAAFSLSAILALVGPAASGQGGQINLDVEDVVLQQGGSILASTLGAGDAGSILIEAQRVAVLGNSSIQSASVTPRETPEAAGVAGTIQIETDRLKVASGGQISTSTRSAGNAGQLEINAADSVEITGRSSFISTDGREAASSGLFSNAIVGSGQAGDIIVKTPSLQIDQGGIISVGNFPSFTGPSPGTGPSGDILITAAQVRLEADSGLDAKTNFNADGPGGANINIDANSILMNDSSFITASAEGTADGGNVTLTAPFLVAVPNTDNNITANANSGDGGNIHITAQGILGLAIRPSVSGNGTNDIDASSQSGASGTISTTGLESDAKVPLKVIPADPRDASELIGSACDRPNEDSGEFIMTGRGGIASLPPDTGTGLAPLIEFDGRLIDPLLFASTTIASQPEENADTTAIRKQAATPHLAPLMETDSQQLPLTEAQAWKYGPDQKLRLIAHHQSPLPQVSTAPCIATTDA